LYFYTPQGKFQQAIYFLFTLFFAFKTVMKDYILFLLSKKMIESQGKNFFHIPYLLDYTFFCSIVFEWEMVYVQWGWGVCGKSKSSSQLKKVCCEASDLHSVVRN